jgi:hypothetical protein
VPLDVPTVDSPNVRPERAGRRLLVASDHSPNPESSRG